MEIFSLFSTTSFDFLQLASGSGGNEIIEEWTTDGIVKLRDGMLQTDNIEQREATVTVHIRPDEPFIATLGGNLVGHGIRLAKDNYESAVYRIESQVEGYDFDLGSLEFYKVTLKPESIWESDLPLE
jgi:hypothetical protein